LSRDILLTWKPNLLNIADITVHHVEQLTFLSPETFVMLYSRLLLSPWDTGSPEY